MGIHLHSMQITPQIIPVAILMPQHSVLILVFTLKYTFTEIYFEYHLYMFVYRLFICSIMQL